MIAQQDAGWLVRFQFRRTTYDFAVNFQPPIWRGSLERKQSVLTRLLRKKQKNVEFDALIRVDSILSSSGLVSEIHWRHGSDDPTINDTTNDDPPPPPRDPSTVN
jgi:hypothetical protein